MGRRIPLTNADKAINRMIDTYPELRRLPDDVSFPSLVDSVTARKIYRALYPNPATAPSSAVEMVSYQYLVLWSAWRHCRQVYRFDSRLSRELCEMEPPGSMPTEAIRRLPYPVMYVDARLDVPFGDGTFRPCEGFFVVPVRRDTSAKDEADGIAVYYDFGEGEMGCTNIPLVGGTLAKAASAVISRNSISWREDRAQELRQRVFRLISNMFNHLLYITADRSDQQVSYIPSGSQKRARRASQSTIHEVGAYIGSRLGEARSRGTAPSAPATTTSSPVGTGRLPRPHVRAAHWHHYWTGPLSGPRELKLEWVGPTFVGPRDQVQSTVVHEAWAEDRNRRDDEFEDDAWKYEDHDER